MNIMFKNRPLLLVIIPLLVFTVVYFWLATPITTDTNIGPRFDWPDETANYFWIDYFAKSGQLSMTEPLNQMAQNQIHPRSFNVLLDGTLVPGSFLGLIVFFGLLAKILGSWIIIYLTPLLSLLGAACFYGIINHFFNRKIAEISTILLLFHPAWWYYTVTSLLPNVAFISLLLTGLFLFLLSTKYIGKKKYLVISLAGLIFGLTINIRPSEIIWAIFLLLVVYLVQRHRINMKQLVIFGFFAAVPFLLIGFYQQNTYGDFLASGYDQFHLESECQWCDITKSLLLPFGFHPRLAFNMAWEYIVVMFLPWTILAVLGFLGIIKQSHHQRRPFLVYLPVSVLLAAWLVVYYGSWQFDDIMTLDLNTLGISYIRYWLALYIAMLPFVALGILSISYIFKERWQKSAVWLLIFGLAGLSAYQVLYSAQDSIMPVRERIAGYKTTAQVVIEQTPDSAVIITQRKDKVLFPERKVVHRFDSLTNDPAIWDIIIALDQFVPVYYLALSPETNTAFGGLFELSKITTVGNEILYEIIVLNNNHLDE